MTGTKSPKGADAVRRSAIDLVATLRARAVRVALLGNMVRRHQDGCMNLSAPLPACVELLEEQVTVMHRVSQVLTGTDPADELPPDIVAWLTVKARDFDILEVCCTLRDLSRVVLEAARIPVTEDPSICERLDDALKNHFQFGRGRCYPAVSEFCDALWQSLDAERDADLARTQRAGNAIADTLSRLERIGRHVRLVSINASVEASRAGDAGKGLAVIAVEFKTLAEEIQNLSATAKTDINGLL